MCRTSKFSCIMTMISDFTIFFQIYLSKFYFETSKIEQNFAFSYDFCNSFVNNFSFLKLIIFIACSLKNSHNFFVESLPFYIMCVFYPCKLWFFKNILDIEKPDGICLRIFFCRLIFRVISTPTNLFYYIFKICINNNGALSDFLHWLISNNLVTSVDMITLQKYLFSHFFLCDSDLFFVLKEWRQFKQQKSP